MVFVENPQLMEELKILRKEIENIIILLSLFIEPKKCVSMFQADRFTDSRPPFNGFYQIYFRSRNVSLLVVTSETSEV